MANFNTKNVSKAEEELKLAHKDLIAFGKLFLPDDFMRSETPFFHYEVADAVNDLDIRQLAVILPRGHGKTVLTKCSIMHDFVLHKNLYFMVGLQLVQKYPFRTLIILNIILNIMIK